MKDLSHNDPEIARRVNWKILKGVAIGFFGALLVIVLAIGAAKQILE